MKRHLSALVFVVVALLGAGITWIVYKAISDTAQAEFQSLAEGAVDRVTGRLDKHLSLLTATRAFMQASGGRVDAAAFRIFVSGLDIEGRHDGIQGIGYAKLGASGDGRFESEVRTEYDLPRAIWPAETAQQWRTPIVLLEPRDPRNDTALGFDMFSEATRRQAMQVAMATGLATASAPVELVQEITSVKQVGFLVYAPFRKTGAVPDADGMPDGFVYAPFRAGDLHAAALEAPPVMPVVMKVYDLSGDGPVELYRSPAFARLGAANGLVTTIDTDVAGRNWRFEVHSTGSIAKYADFLPVYALSVVLTVLAASLAAGVHWQHKAVESVLALHENARRGLEEKELLVQEMRHRIKNSISRMMAIARQTASSSDSLEDFNTSFSARMSAMAKAQDLLARSHWARAKLADLLSTELGQVFGEEGQRSIADGPEINLNERATQALGLVFHEMATNALKYSGVADGEAELSVNWRYEGKGPGCALVLTWTEDGNVVEGEPEGKGFGSRLVEASIRGELGGEIDRSFGPDGMSVTFTIPASAIG
ncbi:CHASE domain-containing protein [Oricola thermophila]|uniref:histidine kinase n=1 Tax=Oricola thermophila TaxID=2742145 RepID=A0A6N1VJF9_9HYPH|nr:CHASE domain-containing protein [Oricola thermophila]QKV19037.1 CHASE domain-containing protein [Oricola thermophila]